MLRLGTEHNFQCNNCYATKRCNHRRYARLRLLLLRCALAVSNALCRDYFTFHFEFLASRLSRWNGKPQDKIYHEEYSAEVTSENGQPMEEWYANYYKDKWRCHSESKPRCLYTKILCQTSANTTQLRVLHIAIQSTRYACLALRFWRSLLTRNILW